MAGIETPVAFVIFRRPDLTRQVWRSIAAARPRRLFVVADGPRADHPGEAELCAAARGITEQIDWPCDVARNYSTHNMGCAERMGSGITWVFDHVEEAIILEDDCVPDATFFRFCSELLERYRDDPRVAMISGDNFLPPRTRRDHSYYFSVLCHIWGWATWRRAWRSFDLEMAAWPAFRRERRLDAQFRRRRDIDYWTRVLDAAHRREIDTWDYAWTFACWLQGGLAILPSANLVTNIGFDSRATHTRSAGPGAEQPRESIEFPLRHPPVVAADQQADEFSMRHHFGVDGGRVHSLVRRLAARLHRLGGRS